MAANNVGRKTVNKKMRLMRRNRNISFLIIVFPSDKEEGEDLVLKGQFPIYASDVVAWFHAPTSIESMLFEKSQRVF
jgi:hypothetical protein